MENNHKAGDARTQEIRAEKRGHGPPVQEGSEHRKPCISWISVISGWLAALGVALALGGALSGALTIGGSGEDIPRSGAARLLLTLTVAFLVGGYVAGRMAGRCGLEHGLLVALSSLIATAVLGLLALVIGVGLAETLNGVTLPGRPAARQSLEALFSPAGILVLVLSFVGAAFGGVRGVKTSHERP